MTDHRLLVFSSEESDRGDDPAGAVDALPGCVGARVYRVSEHQRSTAIACPWAQLTIYELEAEDLAATCEHLNAGGQVDTGSRVAWIYTELAPALRQTKRAASRKAQLGWGEHQFVIMTNPTEGRERDFLAWYDAHVPEILDNYPGLTTGQLFRVSASQPLGAAPEWQYLALYDLEAVDVGDYFKHEPQGLEGMTRHDGALGPHPAQWVYTPIGPRVTRTAAS